MESNEMDLTREQFHELQQKLRFLNISWVDMLVARMKTASGINKDVKKKVTRRKIYNVFAWVIKNRYWRNLVYEHATKLKEELEVQHDKTYKKAAEQP